MCVCDDIAVRSKYNATAAAVFYRLGIACLALIVIYQHNSVLYLFVKLLGIQQSAV